MSNFTFKEKIQILKQSVHMIGFWMTVRFGIIHLLGYMAGSDKRFDRQFGTDTTGIIYSRDLAIDENQTKHNAIFYLPAPPTVTRYMLDSLDMDDGFTFVDYGSGKGRVLMVASEFPFQKIIGVEISRDLHKVAKKNIDLYSNPIQQCSNFELHCMDAKAFMPPGTKTVFHFYHPFLPEVLRPVLKGIGDSLEKNPRKIYVLYLYHIDYVQSVFSEMKFFTKIREVKCMNQQYNWALYTNATFR